MSQDGLKAASSGAARADESVEDSAPTSTTAGLEAAGGARVSVETVLLLFAVAWGVFIIVGPLTDNSFFTHLATGRLILDEGSVPSVDPYSFTAPGTEWTVQSWIPSVLYATAERVAGTVGLRVIGILFSAVAAAILWRLTRPTESLIPRIALLFGALSISSGLWGIRPYMVGVIGLGIVLLVVDEIIPPWTLVPLFWVWANSHGSFPLGLGLIFVMAVGTWLDRESPAAVFKALGFGVAGTLIAVIGPLGLSALTFPLTALERSDILSNITEWQPSSMTDLHERFYLVLVVGTIASLVYRPRWRQALPAAAFIAAGMLAQRNLALATVVLVAVTAKGVGNLGQLRTTDRPRAAVPLIGLGVVTIAMACVAVAARPVEAFTSYPARAVAFLGPEVRMASHDLVGNFLEVLDGPATPVFIDDRVDMYPPEIIEDAMELHRATPRWATVLDDHDIDIVVWRRSSPLASIIAADAEWQVAFSDLWWTVACRRDACSSVLGP